MACDGIHSRVRRTPYPDEGPPKWNGMTMWRALTVGEPFLSGRYTAVGVASIASLDVLLASVEDRPLPPVRWGTIGPDSAKAFRERGLPEPLVPARARLPDLIELLRSEI